MDILSVLKENIAGVLDSLYGLSEARIDLQATREEFAGDVTLLVFPYAKASHKAPEETAREIGEALVQQFPLQQYADSIMPKLMPALFAILCYWLLGKKWMNSNRLILAAIVIATVLAALGVVEV